MYFGCRRVGRMRKTVAETIGRVGPRAGGSLQRHQRCTATSELAHKVVRCGQRRGPPCGKIRPPPAVALPRTALEQEDSGITAPVTMPQTRTRGPSHLFRGRPVRRLLVPLDRRPPVNAGGPDPSVLPPLQGAQATPRLSAAIGHKASTSAAERQPMARPTTSKRDATQTWQPRQPHTPP